MEYVLETGLFNYMYNKHLGRDSFEYNYLNITHEVSRRQGQ